MNIFKTMIDGYLIFNTDPHGSEIPNDDQLLIKKISGFTGSNATVLLTKEKNYLFTDGRYFIQAEKELKNGFHLKRMGIDETISELIIKLQLKNIAADFKRMDGNVLKALKKKIPNLKIKFEVDYAKKINLENYAKIFTELSIENSEEEFMLSNIELFPIKMNFFDKIENIENEEEISLDENEEEIFSENLTAEKINRLHFTKEKIEKLFEGEKFETLILSDLGEIAYLCNIRGSDISYSRLPYAYAIVQRDSIELFVSEKIKFEKENISLKKYSDFYARINLLDEKSCISNKSNAYLHHKFSTISNKLERMMMEKSYYEIRGFFKSNLRDGLALIKFLSRHENSSMTEKELEEELIQYKKREPDYMGESFSPIFAADGNSAMIHYKSGKAIRKNVLLIDQGSQYPYGTTDISRTIFINPTDEMRENYTRVVRGQILGKLARGRKSVFSSFITNLPRLHLNRVGEDYNHGTSHGIAYCGNVHEPSDYGLHNVVTIEPGIYYEDNFGIRLEDDVLVEKEGEYFFVKDLTYVPYQQNMINGSDLEKGERDYLNEYNRKIRKLYLHKLKEGEREFLLKNTEEFK